MTGHEIGILWSTAAPAIGDHLWQSTMFAAAAGLLTLALRNNAARVRYGIWLAASLKFLLPFSLLVVAGSQFSWRHVSPAAATGTILIDELSEPFTQALPMTHAALPIAPASAPQTHWLPILLAIWLCGFLAVVARWTARWRRISAAVDKSTAISEGRELSTLRRLERLAGMPGPIRLLLSQASLEPGIFGIVRPVLLWPDSISERLDDAQLEAVIAHELCHVRRRDNLAAAVHMLVEAVFWFHPLVWWMGARLIAERERACDEAVIELGSHRHTYAESILKVCEFCLGSPLTCVSGVTGADLKKRMVHIMNDRVVRKLTLDRKLLLWTAACLAVGLPLVFGLFKVTPADASESALDQFAGSWQSKYKGRTFFTLNLAVKDGLLTGTAVHSTRMASQNGELVPDSDDKATDRIIEAHASDGKLMLKIEDPEDPSAPIPLELSVTAQNEAEGRLVTDGQSGAPQQTKPWRFVRVSDTESQGSSTPHFSSVSIQPHPGQNNGFVMSRMKLLENSQTQPEFKAVGASVHMLLKAAYEIQESQVVGEPQWTRTERYDISAKVDPSVAQTLNSLSETQRGVVNQEMVRQLLADYFKLSLHQESREQSVYELVLGDGSPKLEKTKALGMTRLGIGEMDASGAPLSILCAELSQRLGRTVVDKTGLQGTYNFSLHWTPDADEMARIRAITGITGPMSPGPGMNAPAPSGPPLMTAVEQQLGLKLQPVTERVPVLVIDHIEQPSQE